MKYDAFTELMNVILITWRIELKHDVYAFKMIKVNLQPPPPKKKASKFYLLKENVFFYMHFHQKFSTILSWYEGFWVKWHSICLLINEDKLIVVYQSLASKTMYIRIFIVLIYDITHIIDKLFRFIVIKWF